MAPAPPAYTRRGRAARHSTAECWRKAPPARSPRRDRARNTLVDRAAAPGTTHLAASRHTPHRLLPRPSLSFLLPHANRILLHPPICSTNESPDVDLNNVRHTGASRHHHSIVYSVSIASRGVRRCLFWLEVQARK